MPAKEIEELIEEAIMEALEEYRTEDFDLSKNFHNVAYRYYSEMEELVYRSDKEILEKAMNFCLNESGDIVVEGPYTGSESGVLVPECGEGLVSVGAFHTHPRDEAYISPRDVVTILEGKDKFACVGTLERDVIITEWAELVELPIVKVLCVDVDYLHPMYDEYASKLLSIGKRLVVLEDKILEYITNGRDAPENMIDEYVNLRKLTGLRLRNC